MHFNKVMHNKDIKRDLTDFCIPTLCMLQHMLNPSSVDLGRKK